MNIHIKDDNGDEMLYEDTNDGYYKLSIKTLELKNFLYRSDVEAENILEHILKILLNYPSIFIEVNNDTQTYTLNLFFKKHKSLKSISLQNQN